MGFQELSNPLPPQFSQRHYTTVLDEDVAVGTKVLTVLAKDVDAGGTVTQYC